MYFFLADSVLWFCATGELLDLFLVQTRNYFGSLECEWCGGDSIVPACEVSIRPWRNEVK